MLPGLERGGGGEGDVSQPHHNSLFHEPCQSFHQIFRLLVSRYWHEVIWRETAVLFKYMLIISACSSVSIYLLPLPQVTQED